MSDTKRVFAEGSPFRYRSGSEWMDFPIRFRWQTGLWFELFQKHVEFIEEDIKRARAEGRLIVYLSCPISARGGGYGRTNVDIAQHAAQRLKEKWGSRMWILNPALYQMESPSGTGLIKRHAQLLTLEKGLKEPINVDELSRIYPVTGGDYLRMWARVLGEDGDRNLGGRFDAFYFLGATDVWDHFTRGGDKTLTEGVEEYFAGKFAIDAGFREYFSPEGGTASEEWERKRKDFFTFYALRASAEFSLGSRDEYNIRCELNRLRRVAYGVGSEIPGYFDGRQLDPAAAETHIAAGYAIS